MTSIQLPPFNIKDPYWNNTHPGMPYPIVERLILIRHGESESNIELTTTGQTTEHAIDHKLTEVGKQQAQDIANFLKEKGIDYDDCNIDRIHISPLWRAIETALPTLKQEPYSDIIYPHEGSSTEFHDKKKLFVVEINYELREKYSKEAYLVNMPYQKLYWEFQLYEMINFDKEHNCITKEHTYEDYAKGIKPTEPTWLRQPETDTEFKGRMKRLMDSYKNQGTTVKDRKQTIIFTHSQVISQLLAGDSDHSFHLANGSISIIDIDEKRNLHVQVANYTKHLCTPTGMHTCII